MIQRHPVSFFFFFNDTATTEIYTLSLHDALPIFVAGIIRDLAPKAKIECVRVLNDYGVGRVNDLMQALEIIRSEEHTSELQSRLHLVCRLLLEKKKKYTSTSYRCILQTKTDAVQL